MTTFLYSGKSNCLEKYILEKIVQIHETMHIFTTGHGHHHSSSTTTWYAHPQQTDDGKPDNMERSSPKPDKKKRPGPQPDKTAVELTNHHHGNDHNKKPEKARTKCKPPGTTEYSVSIWCLDLTLSMPMLPISNLDPRTPLVIKIPLFTDNL